jgi:UDPglucose--hexose-1-phosphate uridylyltransferase
MYEMAVFENRFPAFRRRPPTARRARAPYASGRALGASEVVLYSAEHEETLAGMSVGDIEQLIDVWRDRYVELGARQEVEYVFIFENRGREIGVTLTHPHGQIYGLPFVPPRIHQELSAAARYRRETKQCLYCDIVRTEAAGTRVVVDDDAFVAFVPYFARVPFEVHVASRQHRGSLEELQTGEGRSMARVLKGLLLKYDGLFGFPLPLTMSMHQRPTDGKRHAGSHLHIEFAPVHRSATKMKYLAGSEMGAGTFLNDVPPEEAAQQLRQAERGG